MKDTQEHTSPDGTLRLVVWYEGDDGILGFDGYDWHTHGDILAKQYGLLEGEAIERFVSDILRGRAVIVISRLRAHIRDIWISSGPEEELNLRENAEQLELRYWDGTAWRSSS
jgi:hypothetical protein